ncbi:MAG TPA: hypothetical protein VL307_00300 [Chitinophagaceae bacterium]|nr:hypothetical protein [Chitinophagaceae bacterium]
MNTRILLLAVSMAALSSCSVYKAGQTPDDVYYSPARVQQEKDSYVEVRQEKPGSNYQSYEQYQDSYRDDRFLRMSIGNPYYMNSYNAYSGFDWRYNSFYNGFNYGFNSPWNNYFAWNNFYNPYALSFGGFYGGAGYYGYPVGAGYGYYSGGGYYGGGGTHYPINTAPITRPRVFNVNSYSNTNRSGNRTYSNSYYNNNSQRYNNGNSGSGNRSYYDNSGNNNSNNRSMYTPSNSGNSNTPSRSYTPSSGGSSGGGGSTGGGGGVSRPTRGN